MANYMLIGGDQKQYGPVGDDQLRQWIREGRIGSQSQAKAEGDAEWRPVSQFREFADMFGGGAAGPAQTLAPSANATRLNTKLKVLVCVEALFIVCTVIISIFATSFLPVQLQDYEASVSAAPRTLIDWIAFGLIILLLPTALTATVGLLCNWRPARALFLWTRIAVVVISPLQGIDIETGWADLFDGGAVLIAGVIIGMLYCSPVKELYDKPRDPLNTAPRPPTAAP